MCSFSQKTKPILEALIEQENKDNENKSMSTEYDYKYYKSYPLRSVSKEVLSNRNQRPIIKTEYFDKIITNLKDKRVQLNVKGLDPITNYMSEDIASGNFKLHQSKSSFTGNEANHVSGPITQIIEVAEMNKSPSSLLFLTNMESDRKPSHRKDDSKLQPIQPTSRTKANNQSNLSNQTKILVTQPKKNLYKNDLDEESKAFRLRNKFNLEINPNKLENFNKEALYNNSHPKFRFYTVSVEKMNLNKIIKSSDDDLRNPEVESRSKSLIKMIEKEKSFLRFKRLENKLPKILEKVQKN